MPFASLGLTAALRDTLASLGYAQPTPVQTQAIPKILAKHDLIGIAQTGTGKTAAFTLPLIQRLVESKTADGAAVGARALILTPTRELALQVYASVERYGQGSGLSAVVLHGGVSYAPQLAKLAAGVDIVVATPGRLRDHLEQKTISLAGLEILVLDEADRMLDMGFSEDVGVIVHKSSASRQTLLFSATFSDDVRMLAQKFLTKPVSIHATPLKVTAQNVMHTVHPVDPARKLDLLFEVIHKNLTKQILVFARTKDRVDEVSKDLISRGLVCMATHGDRTQAHRTKALARFKEGKVQILVATDIAARGLDTSDLELVINFELPHLAEDYVHRIGRTGRAGKAGHAVSLVTEGELRHLGPIEALIKFKLAMVPVTGFEPLQFSPARVAQRAVSWKERNLPVAEPKARTPGAWGRVRDKREAKAQQRGRGDAAAGRTRDGAPTRKPQAGGDSAPSHKPFAGRDAAAAGPSPNRASRDDAPSRKPYAGRDAAAAGPSSNRASRDGAPSRKPYAGRDAAPASRSADRVAPRSSDRGSRDSAPRRKPDAGRDVAASGRNARDGGSSRKPDTAPGNRSRKYAQPGRADAKPRPSTDAPRSDDGKKKPYRGRTAPKK